MAAVRLYLADSHQTTCDAEVTTCTPWKNGGYAITLTETVFFPEGGGQPADHGTLTAGGRIVSVNDVRDRDGDVLHLTRDPLEPGTAATATIDWARRRDHIQQHTGEHILSNAIWQLFGVANIGFHLGHEAVTIDLDRALAPEELDRAEDFANTQVTRCLPIRTFSATPGQLKTMKLRKATDKIEGDLRVVEIQDDDRCTCCGTHAKQTGEVGLIKILRQDKYKGGVQLSFLSGDRALADYRRKNLVTLEAGALFSVKETDIPDAIRRLRAESSATGARLRDATTKLMDYQAAELLASATEEKGQRALVVTREDCLPKEARILLNRLLETPSLVVCLVAEHQGQLSYFVAKSPGSNADCAFLCNLLGGLLSGKGGGRDSFCQGSAKASGGWQEATGMMAQHMLPRE